MKKLNKKRHIIRMATGWITTVIVAFHYHDRSILSLKNMPNRLAPSNFTLPYGQFINFTLPHYQFINFTLSHCQFINFTLPHGQFINFIQYNADYTIKHIARSTYSQQLQICKLAYLPTLILVSENMIHLKKGFSQ